MRWKLLVMLWAFALGVALSYKPPEMASVSVVTYVTPLVQHWPVAPEPQTTWFVTGHLRVRQEFGGSGDATGADSAATPYCLRMNPDGSVVAGGSCSR